MNMDGARILVDLAYLFCQALYGTFSVLIRVPIAIISFISFPSRYFRCAAKILSVSAKSWLTVLYRFDVLNFFPFLTVPFLLKLSGLVALSDLSSFRCSFRFFF